jgi:RNA polymerase sigma factor (sigma-70 family)
MARIRSRSDARLLQDTPSDPEAFAEFYRRYERDVLTYFARWSRDAAVAADLMAETFAEAFASAPRYRPELGLASAWLFGIGRHILLRSVRQGRVQDETRRRLGMGPMMLDDTSLERVDELVSSDGRASDALNDLSGLLREAVAGRVIEEREYRELAQSLQCSESVVRQRVRRGLAQMRDRLEAER